MFVALYPLARTLSVWIDPGGLTTPFSSASTIPQYHTSAWRLPGSIGVDFLWRRWTNRPRRRWKRYFFPPENTILFFSQGIFIRIVLESWAMLNKFVSSYLWPNILVLRCLRAVPSGLGVPSRPTWTSTATSWSCCSLSTPITWWANESNLSSGRAS